MNKKFPIFEIAPEVPEESEVMGTKEKFWFHHDKLGLCLYNWISCTLPKTRFEMNFEAIYGVGARYE